jgi:hypothetical protein
MAMIVYLICWKTSLFHETKMRKWKFYDKIAHWQLKVWKWVLFHKSSDGIFFTFIFRACKKEQFIQGFNMKTVLE